MIIEINEDNVVKRIHYEWSPKTDLSLLFGISKYEQVEVPEIDLKKGRAMGLKPDDFKWDKENRKLIKIDKPSPLPIAVEG